MYCRDCGAKLTLRFLENEGLIPYCEQCGAFKFPLFPVAVSMTVVNRAENKILLAREETRLTAIKWRYHASRYHEARDVLMLNFIVTADEGDISLNEEIEEVHWFTPDEAKEHVIKGSTAEYFLLGALNELGRKK